MKKIFVLAFLLTMTLLISAAASGQGSSSWTCLVCGAENTGNYCEECGHIRGSWVCPDCQSINTKNFCPVCGKAKSDAVGKGYDNEGRPVINTSAESAAAPIREEKQVRVGDIITFGRYEQDNNLNNGTEAIEWLVLAAENDRALLLSKYGLETKPYNDVPKKKKEADSLIFMGWDFDGDGIPDFQPGPSDSSGWDHLDEDLPEEVTWEKCTLRKWLNGDFYQTAFSNQEQGRILSVTNKNPDHPEFGTRGGNDTTDRIFLLSVDEVYQYFSGNEVPKCRATAVAAANNAYINYYGISHWWLRSPGYMGYAASVVVDDLLGISINYGNHVDSDKTVVRPAFWLKLQ